ncbi:MAG: hypothetical protein K6T94_02160 [Paenibacillus sp.]|nr:hypothetical protein [Paenibacillus sp.]
MTRLLASVLSALVVSLVFTMISQNNNIEADVLYYSFANEFLNGFTVMLCIYLFFATPVSFYIDKMTTNRNMILHVLLYFFVGAIFGAMFILINSASDVKAGIQLASLFGLGASVFSLFLNFIRRVRKNK